jgi:hypothetical protein
VVDLTVKDCDVNSQIYHTLDKHNNNYIIVLNSQICHTLDEHNNHYITVLNRVRSTTLYTSTITITSQYLTESDLPTVKYCDVMIIVLV